MLSFSHEFIFFYLIGIAIGFLMYLLIKKSVIFCSDYYWFRHVWKYSFKDSVVKAFNEIWN